MMPESAITLLLQIPLAGVVVFVVWMYLRHQERANQQMLNFMAEQAAINREFLKTQREQYNAALGRLAEEQKEMRVQVTRLTDAINKLLERTVAKRNRNTA